MTNVLEINSIEELRPFHLAWNALHAETPSATFFQTFEWLESYWQHFQAEQRLRVLIVRSSDRPIGILPLIEKTEVTHLGSVRVLTYPLDNWGSRFGPIGPNQTATVTLAMRHIRQTQANWDLFQPRWTTHETIDHGRTELAMRLAGLPATVEADSQSSLIDCGQVGSWEGYLASRSAKTRHEIRRKRRQLQANHWVEHLRHCPAPQREGDGDPRWDLYECCLDVARRSWQAKSTDGVTLCSPRVSRFLRDAHEQASRLGMVDMNILSVDGVPAAFYYGYRCEGELEGLRMGYDPTLAKGTGSVLLGLVIQGGFARGDRRIDLGIGNEPYKARFRTTVETSCRLTHIPTRAWRPRALTVARRLGRKWLSAS